MLRPTVVNLCGGQATCDVYIGRAMPSHGLGVSEWANLHKIKSEADREEALERYRTDILANPKLLMKLHELQGMKLGCWCHPKPCHGHVLAAFVEALMAKPVQQLRHFLETNLPAEKTLEFLNRSGWFSGDLRSWDDVPEDAAIRFILRDVRPRVEVPAMKQAALF